MAVKQGVEFTQLERCAGWAAKVQSTWPEGYVRYDEEHWLAAGRRAVGAMSAEVEWMLGAGWQVGFGSKRMRTGRVQRVDTKPAASVCLVGEIDGDRQLREYSVWFEPSEGVVEFVTEYYYSNESFDADEPDDSTGYVVDVETGKVIH